MQPDTQTPFVLYRLPGESEIHFIRQKDSKVYQSDNLKRDGFYLAPFRNEKHPVLFIPSEHAIREIVKAEIPVSGQSWIAGEEQILHPDHPERVAQAVKEIRKNADLEKLVISNRLDVPVRQFDLTELFMRMAKAYPRSFVYVWHHPTAGVTMAGATPEILLSYQKDEGDPFYTGTTMSLAGTKFAEENRPWTDKEKEEQQIVTRYVEEVLNSLRLAYFSDGPKDYVQGDLIHILTEMTFIFPEIDYVDRLLDALHPTPAVAGLPKDIALKHIPRIESYDRGYYTGFIGIKSGYEGRFYVNLRSMKITEDWVNLYAGGGITADSDPQQEWDEVRRKWNIMRRILEGKLRD